MSAKIDMSNPVVIVAIIGAVWFFATKNKQVTRVITPQQAGSAPSKVGAGTASLVNQLFGGISNMLDTRSDVGKLFDKSVGQLTYDPAQAMRELYSDDGFGMFFGGGRPAYNSDNIGGSSFDGGLSVGTGLALY